MRRLALVVVLVVATGSMLILVHAAAPKPTLPRPLAIVERWAIDSGVGGLRCTAVAIGPQRIWTAGHCLVEGEQLGVVVGSLCDRSDDHALLSAARTVAGPELSGADLVVERLARPIGAEVVTPAAARPGPAVVYGYGDDPDIGRPGCEPSAYEGLLTGCPVGVAAVWCLKTKPGVQLCGGSSGAPVFVLHDDQWVVVGVISGGPRCGEPGWAVVASPS